MTHQKINYSQRALMRNCLFYFILYIIAAACAQPISPTGGKKDIIPPKLLTSTPINKQTNYKGRTVDLEFDEYIVAENLQQKLLITPDAGEYDFKARPTGLRITFKKSLDTATTYSLSFGDAIKDFSEKNPVKNLRVVFSTGLGIDSASISGQVKDLLSNKPLLDVLVGMYPNTDTLNIEKMKPSYFTRSDSSGRFSIENIRPNIYRLFAFDDKNRSLTYNSKAERIAYLRDSINIFDSTQISGVSLKLFMANNTPPKVRNTQPRANYYSVIYDKGFLEYKVKFDNPEDSIPHFQAGTNELKFYNTKNRKDTLVAKIVIKDSVGLTFEHTQKIKFREERGGGKKADSNREPFEMKTNFPENGEIEPRNFELKLTFTKPIAEARLNQIQIVSDSTKAEIIKISDFKWKNNKTILSLSRPITARRQLKIVLPKATFFSVENDTIPARTYKLPIMDEENYGTLEGEVKGTKNKFIIQLLDEKFEVVKSISNKTPYTFSYLKPATYTLRVIIDENGNGKWDSGDVKTKRLAEPIFFHTEVVKVKKNFVMSGIDIDLSTK
ncbi:Ig-like domain-containing domain [Runella sp.]|uniref:Ig-like domain-containing domain n=1 Tax=Runella sp. TaxID=1960881 RepID=UPI003D0ACC42